MTLTSTRKITVQDMAFRWKVRSGKGRLTGNSGPGLVLIVQAESGGQIMQMHLFSKAYTQLDEYEQEHGRHKASLRPSNVRSAIEYSLALGWASQIKGPPYKPKGPPYKPKGPLDLGEYELPG
jgi:hypothetical protein